MKKKVFSWLLVLSLGIAALATGCSPKTDSSSSRSESSGSLTTVKLQLKWLPQAQFMGYYVAQEKGYYKDEGIDLKIMAGGPDIVPVNQVNSSAADFAIADLYGLLAYQEKGYPVVNVAQVFQDSSFRLVSLKKSNIASITDLKGKKVGAWLGSGAEFPIYAMLDKYQLNKDSDLTIAKQDYTMDALIKGSIDVASAHTYNEYNVLIESGISASDINVIDPNKEGITLLEDCLVANSNWLKNNKDLTVKFLKATIKGWKDACADPVAAAQIVWKNVDQSSTTLQHQTSMAEEIAKIVVPSGFDSAKIGYIDPALVKQTVDLSVKYNVIKSAPTTISDDQYWTAATGK